MLAARRLARSPLLRRALCASAQNFSPPQQLIEPEDMTGPLRRRVAALEGIQGQIEHLEEELDEKMRQLEAEYEARSSALQTVRREIVLGDREPTEEEVQASVYYREFLADSDAPVASAAQPDVGVPAFWPTALRESPTMHSIPDFEISDADWQVLAYLTDMRMKPWDGDQDYLPDGWSSSEPGFSVHFSFAPNPMLETLELAVFCSSEMVVHKVHAPVWTDDRLDPTKKLMTKKIKKKGSAAEATKKVVAKETDSFFRIFREPEPEEQEEEGSFDPEAMEIPMDKLRGLNGMYVTRQLQAQILYHLKTDIMPNASMHYISALQGVGVDEANGRTNEEAGRKMRAWQSAP